MSDPDPQAQAQASPSRGAQLVVTVVLLVLFTCLLLFLLNTADEANETTWQRRIYVLGVAQAIVFTAVGWLFGREVYRVEATTARQDASVAKQQAATAQVLAQGAAQEAATKAEEAAVERTKSQAVNGAVRILAAASSTPADEGGGARPVSLDMGAPRDNQAASLAALLGMVNGLWPPESGAKP